MVYGTQPLLPTEYIAPTFQSMNPREYSPYKVLAARIQDIHHLEEIRALAIKNITDKQTLNAEYFQASQLARLFQKGDQVLWCPRDPKLKKTKFETIWHGPYRVQLVLPNNTVLLVNNDYYDKQATIVNTNKLKHYHTTANNVAPKLSLGEIYNNLAEEAHATEEQAEDTTDMGDNTTNPDLPTVTHVNHIRVEICEPEMGRQPGYKTPLQARPSDTRSTGSQCRFRTAGMYPGYATCPKTRPSSPITNCSNRFSMSTPHSPLRHQRPPRMTKTPVPSSQNPNHPVYHLSRREQLRAVTPNPSYSSPLAFGHEPLAHQGSWSLSHYDQPRLDRAQPPSSTDSLPRRIHSVQIPPQTSSHSMANPLVFLASSPQRLLPRPLPSSPALQHQRVLSFHATFDSALHALPLALRSLLDSILLVLTHIMDSKTALGPIYLPRMVREWKRKTDGAWLTKTNLIQYWTRLDGKVDVARCLEFLKSMKSRSEEEQFPAGYVDGILVQYSPRYLHAFFGWDGTGITKWTPECRVSAPNVTDAINGVQPEADGRYDVFALGSALKEPWFARMQGVLSQIFFKNNCNRIEPQHLSILLLADKGEKVNWGLILDDQFRVQLRGYRRSEDYSSPIGPFLTAYISKFLAYHRMNHQPPRIGTFLDVQRNMAMAAIAASRDPAAPSSSKRPRVADPATSEGGNDKTNLGPQATDFQEQSKALATCMERMLQFMHTVEQERTTMVAQHDEVEERHKRKAAQVIQAAQARAKQTIAEAREECRSQLSEAQQTMGNFRNQVATLELELTASREQVDTMEKARKLAEDRALRLEQQNEEALARYKTLSKNSNPGTGTSTMEPSTTEELMRLQQARVETENARTNFEVNKSNWVQHAAKLIATHAHRMLWEHPPASAIPPQEFLDSCIDDALVDLDLEQSEPTWDMDLEDMAVETLAPLEQQLVEPSNTMISTIVSIPAIDHEQEVYVHVPALFPENQEQPDRVHIPDLPTDTEDTPNASPRPSAPAPTLSGLPATTSQAGPSQSNLTVPAKPRSFREHKIALQKLEEDYDMEGEGSEDSDAEEDSDTAIAAVQDYFASHPDLDSRYSNPEADNVQCPACNKLLGKTVFDVYQHARTSRTKHNLLHRGVAAAIATIFGNQDPPRRHAQIPREKTRPDRRPAARRSKH